MHDGLDDFVTYASYGVHPSRQYKLPSEVEVTRNNLVGYPKEDRVVVLVLLLLVLLGSSRQYARQNEVGTSLCRSSFGTISACD